MHDEIRGSQSPNQKAHFLHLFQRRNGGILRL